MLFLSVVPLVGILEPGGIALYEYALLRLQCSMVCGFQDRIVKDYLSVTYLFQSCSGSQNRPSGIGPVGPAMAGPTFELGRIFFYLTKISVNSLKLKVYTILR